MATKWFFDEIAGSLEECRKKLLDYGCISPREASLAKTKIAKIRNGVWPLKAKRDHRLQTPGAA